MPNIAMEDQKPLSEINFGTGIFNKIEVKPKVTPTEVKRKIEEALRRSAELDARRISVEVEGSKVSLYGRFVHGPRRKKPRGRPGPHLESGRLRAISR